MDVMANHALSIRVTPWCMLIDNITSYTTIFLIDWQRCEAMKILYLALMSSVCLSLFIYGYYRNFNFNRFKVEN
jgi:hypothetical protein